MPTYSVAFAVNLCTTFDIEAESEEEARQIGEDLLDRDAFREDVIAALDDPFAGWNDIEVDAVYDLGNEKPEYTKQDLADRFGWTPQMRTRPRL